MTRCCRSLNGPRSLQISNSFRFAFRCSPQVDPRMPRLRGAPHRHHLSITDAILRHCCASSRYSTERIRIPGPCDRLTLRPLCYRIVKTFEPDKNCYNSVLLEPCTDGFNAARSAWRFTDPCTIFQHRYELIGDCAINCPYPLNRSAKFAPYSGARAQQCALKVQGDDHAEIRESFYQRRVRRNRH